MAEMAMTVLGPVSPDQLGVTLPHEHILIDLRCWWIDPPEASLKAIAREPVSLANLGILRREPFMSQDNLVLLDAELALEEVGKFKRAGGSTITDVTNLGIGRDPLVLKGISIETGLNIIMGSGYYIAASHPPEINQKTVKEIEEEIVQDVTVGVGDTGVRAGIIGEIGTSYPITDNEVTSLRAAARAQRRTGAPLTLHPYPWAKEGLAILDIIEEDGADLSRVIMSHMNPTLYDQDYHRAIAQRGTYIEFDLMGMEFYGDSSGISTPRDTESVASISQLIADGHLERILMSHDVCLKMQLTAYGGWGYAHILHHIVPMLKKEGVTDEQIQTILVKNPRRVLTFV